MEERSSFPSLSATTPALFRLGRLLRACAPLPGGVVSLVGAGPGDPGLLTVKAARRLGEADVVYHDALVSEPLLELCRPGARLVPVGKRRGFVTLSQDGIVSALVRDARRGLAVVRLKGGDPFVFGRGGEEALALLERGVTFEIVPGVSSGISVPAAAGIPVTHRGLSGSVAFVTAHDLGEGAAGAAVRARLVHLARGAETIVVFMAGAELAGVRSALLEGGLPEDTPAAVIESGTLPGQRVARGTLGGLALPPRSRAGGPVLIVVGRTVALGDRLSAAAAPRRPRSRSASRERAHG
jgi:uroporphyrin-III C-methyltransferase